MMREIQIVGGGLAGLALGIGLRKRGTHVVLHEANAYPRHRVCGEFIAGLRPNVLSELGIEDCLDDAYRLTNSIWRLHDRVVYRRALPKPALGISRHLLDQRLASRFEEMGGELRVGSRVGEGADDGFVWANGRVRGGNEWLGLKMHCRNLTLSSDLELHLGTQAYVGLSVVEDGRVNVCGLFRQRPIDHCSRVERLPAYLEAAGLGTLADQVRAGDPDPISAVGVTSLSYTPQAPDACLRLGDQSGLIAPFTGNGMAQALEGSALALEPLMDYAHGRAEWPAVTSEVNGRIRKAFARRRAIARCLHPWLLYRPQQNLLAALARGRMLPFALLYRLTH